MHEYEYTVCSCFFNCINHFCKPACTLYAPLSHIFHAVISPYEDKNGICSLQSTILAQYVISFLKNSRSILYGTWTFCRKTFCNILRALAN